MFELLELILSILQDLSAADNSDSVVNSIPYETNIDEPRILASSPSEDGKPKKTPKGDAGFCKELTDKVINMHRNSSIVNPFTVVVEKDEQGKDSSSCGCRSRLE